MKKIILSLFLITGFCFNGFSQYRIATTTNNRATAVNQNKSGFDPKKITYGGSFGLGFGSDNYWNIQLSPQIGYRFTNKFTAGFGISYSHSEEKYNSWNSFEKVKHTQNYVGMNLFAHYYPINWLVFTLKPEGMRIWDSYSGGGADSKTEEFIPAVPIGVGIRFKPIIVTLNYDLVQDKRKPYGDNIFWSFGIFF